MTRYAAIKKEDRKEVVLRFRRDPYRIKITLFTGAQLRIASECSVGDDCHRSEVDLHGKELDALVDMLRHHGTQKS